MKGICITGANPLYLQRVLDSLEHAGAQPALSARREEPIGIHFWHEQVMAAAADDSEVPRAIDKPGRMSAQLASDIVVANLKSKVWAWADKHSMWLLDYWLGFDARLVFILVVTSPQHMLASAMQTRAEAFDVHALMGAWQVQHQELLRFYRSNPRRCLLVDALECVKNPVALIERANCQWKLALSPAGGRVPEADTPNALALGMAQQICNARPEAIRLQHEIAATIAQGAQSLLANAQVKVPVQEVERLLSQLPEVQEELEHQFLEDHEVF